MPRLIDADELKELEEMEYVYFRKPAAVPFYEADRVWDVINNAPTISPESLRPKGRWEYHGGDDDMELYGWCLKCNRCWHEELTEEFNYCPNCGAMMEG